MAPDPISLYLQHIWKGVLLGIAAAFATAVVLFQQTPVYEARSVLLVQLGRDYVFVPDTPVSGLRTPDPGRLDVFVNAEIQLLDSSRVYQSALEQLLAAGVYTISPETSRDQLLDDLQDAVKVNLITGSYMIDLRVRDTDPARVAAGAKAMVTAYLELRGSMIGVDPPEFLQAQVEIATQKLREVDQSLAALAGAGSPVIQEGRLSALNDQKLANDQELDSQRAVVAGLTARLVVLQDRVTTDASEAIPPLLLETEADLAAATANLAVLVATSDALSAQLQRQEAAISDVAVLWAEREAAIDALTQLQGQLAASRVSVARTEAGLGMVRVIEDGSQTPSSVGLPDRLKLIGAALVGFAVFLMAILIFGTLSPRRQRSSVAR